MTRDIGTDIEAEVIFLTPEEGGRTHPYVYKGYRPNFSYDGTYWCSFHLCYVDANRQEIECVPAGQLVTAYIGFLSPEAHADKLHVGREFLVTEGGHVVGKGRVTRILNLMESAEQAIEEQ